MRALAAGFAFAFLIALVLTPLVRRLALALGALDQLSARKVHSGRQVPRMGGLGIAVAFYGTLMLLWLLHSQLFQGVLDEGQRVLALLCGGCPILLLGCIDDLRGMRALTKLTVQAAVATSLWWLGLRVDGALSLWTAGALPAWASLALTVLWISGVINAVNLIDGLDGLASGVAFFALLATVSIALLRGDLLLALLAATLCGAVLGFLVFNWNPASIFMGDTGSMFLGYVLATTSIWAVQKSATAVLVMFPAVALALPLLDTTLTIGRRILSGRPVMQADRDHVHHRLLGRGLSHRQTVGLLYAVCAVFSGLSVAIACASRALASALLLLSGLFALTLAYALGYVAGGPQGIWHSLRQRSRNRALLQRLEALGQELAQVTELADLEAAVRAFGDELKTVSLRLEITPIGGWSLGSDVPQPGLTHYPIRLREGLQGYLEACIDERDISPDDRVLMQLLCDLIAPFLGRLRRSRWTPTRQNSGAAVLTNSSPEVVKRLTPRDAPLVSSKT